MSIKWEMMSMSMCYIVLNVILARSMDNWIWYNVHKIKKELRRQISTRQQHIRYICGVWILLLWLDCDQWKCYWKKSLIFVSKILHVNNWKSMAIGWRFLPLRPKNYDITYFEYVSWLVVLYNNKSCILDVRHLFDDDIIRQHYELLW